ncbi:beta-klotho-like [Arapaima gigas]
MNSQQKLKVPLAAPFMMICSSPRHPAPTGLVVLVLCHCASLGALAGLGRELWRHPALGSGSVNESQLFLHATFPAGFLWGTGSSAFQTEGAWDEDGKGPSIWDTFTHSHTRYSGATANIASASYHHWEEDVAALKLLGVHHYAFSLSWPRLFPNGDALGPPNPAAVTHYNRLINQLRQEGIEPVVTLYHWDLPLALQEWHGGWLNDTLVDAFDHYAAFCFRTFGNRVRYWVTIHNPYLVAWQGYTTGLHAPGQMESPEATFTVAHNLIKVCFVLP